MVSHYFPMYYREMPKCLKSWNILFKSQKIYIKHHFVIGSVPHDRNKRKIELRKGFDYKILILNLLPPLLMFICFLFSSSFKQNTFKSALLCGILF